MLLYKNNKAIQTYPFACYTQIPEGQIQNIQVVLKNTTQVPFVSAISCAREKFTLQLQTPSQYLGTFTYTDSLWISLQNQNVFGFVKLASRPLSKYAYRGPQGQNLYWTLDRRCYTFYNELKGVQKVSVNGLPLDPSDILDIQWTGDFKLRQGSDSAVTNIGRSSLSSQMLGAYTQASYILQPCVRTVNGYSCKNLEFSATGTPISIYGPSRCTPEAGAEHYVLYITSTQGFPTCAAQEPQAAETEV